MNIPIPALLQRLGIEQLNPMQEKVLEVAATNDQLVVLAPTGSGKTLGFLLPLLRLSKNKLHRACHPESISRSRSCHPRLDRGSRI